MTNQEVMETYGKSVHQIRLDIACQLYIRSCADGSEQFNMAVAGNALQTADIFIQRLMED
jgi:hypothetical protein